MVIPFLDRLVGHLGRKVHLIVDGHDVHQAIEMHVLPGYSPELNPDEILGRRPQTRRVHQRSTENPADLEHTVRSFLHRLQKLPDRIRSYFDKPEVRYSAQQSHICFMNQ
ncbi:hypothetical protein ACWDKQ_34065 [Saccharopolyspora sp. NPDC000995]